MLTQTSELAIKSLLLLGLEGDGTPQSPKPLAEKLDCSPSYLAKVFGLLVKSGILRSVRGAHGGVTLAKDPAEITLRAIVESCQGLLIGNYCLDIASHRAPVCAFHRAMEEVYVATTQALEKWTLADLLRAPTPGIMDKQSSSCKMSFEGCEKFRGGIGRPTRGRA